MKQKATDQVKQNGTAQALVWIKQPVSDEDAARIMGLGDKAKFAPIKTL